jgi:hypothetical protein
LKALDEFRILHALSPCGVTGERHAVRMCSGIIRVEKLALDMRDA